MHLQYFTYIVEVNQNICSKRRLKTRSSTGKLLIGTVLLYKGYAACAPLLVFKRQDELRIRHLLCLFLPEDFRGLHPLLSLSIPTEQLPKRV